VSSLQRNINPQKHAIVTAIPTLWDLFLKKWVKKVHDTVSPIPEDEEYALQRQERQKRYDTMYDHLREPLPNEIGDKVVNVLKKIKDTGTQQLTPLV